MHTVYRETNLADHVFHISVTGDIVEISVLKTKNGLLFTNDDPQLESLRAAVLRFGSPFGA